MNCVHLDVHSLTKSFDGVKALANFSCSLQHREILGLIGPNGAGKTTFFNVVSGFIVPDIGNIFYKGNNITGTPPYQITNMGISRTFQNLHLIQRISVLDNILLFFQNQIGEKFRYTFFNWRHIREQENSNRKEAMVLLEEVGLSSKAGDPSGELSYGQQKLLSLVCCLAAKSEILLLDEPFSGIAPEMARRIIDTIRSLPSKGKSVILIEHDLNAVMNICDRVIFMEEGAKVSEGTPQEVRNDPRVIEAYLY